MNNYELSPPDITTRQLGTIATGPIKLDVHSEREVLVEQLQPLVSDAFIWQFGLWSQIEGYTENGTISQTDTNTINHEVLFLADLIQTVRQVDDTDEKKQESMNILFDIVVNGMYDGQVFDMTYSDDYSALKVTHNTEDINQATMFGRKCRSVSQKLNRRNGLARLYLDSPETAEYLIKSQTIGLHGTRSGALPSILDNGLLSTSEIRKRGTQPVSGEHAFHGKEGQPTVSLIDWQSSSWLYNYSRDDDNLTPERVSERITSTQKGLELAMQQNSAENGTDTVQQESFYTQGLQSLLTQLRHTRDLLQSESISTEQKMLLEANFPIIIGVDRKALAPGEKPIIPSGHVDGEFMIDEGIPSTSISMIFAPSERIAEVEQLCRERHLDVRVVDTEVYRRAFPLAFPTKP